MLPTKVTWSDRVEKQLGKIPIHIQEKFRAWMVSVEEDGIHIVRRRHGFHDEALKGLRLGQRSVRLNKAYRVIYVQKDQSHIRLIQVIEVNKHEY